MALQQVRWIQRRDGMYTLNMPLLAGKNDDRKIYVGRLNQFVTHDDLNKYFNQFGQIEGIELKPFYGPELLKGYAFILFKTQREQERALAYRNHSIGGNYIFVNTPKSEHVKLFLPKLDQLLTESMATEYFLRFTHKVKVLIHRNRDRLHQDNYGFLIMYSKRAAEFILRVGIFYIYGQSVPVQSCKVTNEQRNMTVLAGGATNSGMSLLQSSGYRVATSERHYSIRTAHVIGSRFFATAIIHMNTFPRGYFVSAINIMDNYPRGLFQSAITRMSRMTGDSIMSAENYINKFPRGFPVAPIVLIYRYLRSFSDPANSPVYRCPHDLDFEMRFVSDDGNIATSFDVPMNTAYWAPRIRSSYTCNTYSLVNINYKKKIITYLRESSNQTSQNNSEVMTIQYRETVQSIESGYTQIQDDN